MDSTTSASGSTNKGNDAAGGTNGSGAAQSDSSKRDDAASKAMGRSSASMREELSGMKKDLDGLLSKAGDMTDQELSQAHDQMMAQFSSVRHAARGMATEASRQLNRGVDATTEYVKDKPMQSVAVAAGLGLALGMIFGRS